MPVSSFCRKLPIGGYAEKQFKSQSMLRAALQRTGVLFLGEPTKQNLLHSTKQFCAAAAETYNKPQQTTPSNPPPRPQQQQQHIAGSQQQTTKKIVIMSSATEKPKVVFVLGGPGAGKGTQCSKIVDRFQFVHLSAGDLLREERAREGSEFGALIEDYIRNGKIVPVEVTCSLLENAMNKSGKERFLIDGFPRNQDNLDGWNRQMADKVDFQFVLFFNCGEDVCVQRCLSRGQSGSGRSDDNLDSLKKRIQTYNNDSLPIIKYFEENGEVKQIDASLNADQVFNEVERIFIGNGFQ